jgi:AcrR family transcriptional regulator
MAADATRRRGPGRPPTSERAGPSSRARLLDAAAKVFAQRGFRAATIDQIAAEAGLSKGTVYWNFDSKADLFAALLEQRIDEPAEQLMEITRTAAAEDTTASAVSAGLAALIDQQEDVFLLLHEYWAAAVRDPALRRSWRKRQARLRKSLARAIEARAETTGLKMTLPAEQVATVFIALAYGLAMEALADPDVLSEGLYGEFLALTYDGMAARAGRVPS